MARLFVETEDEARTRDNRLGKAGALPTEPTSAGDNFKLYLVLERKTEARTRDNQLGRLELYQRSYFRITKR